MEVSSCMEANISSSAESSGDINANSAISTDVVPPIIAESTCTQSNQEPTPMDTIECSNHDPHGGEINETTVQQEATTPRSRPSSPDGGGGDGGSQPPTEQTAASANQQPTGSGNDEASAANNSSSNLDASGSSGSETSSSPVVTNPIASDHCYGLPYQDHNYGTASYSANRNNSGNGNGNGNNGSGNGTNGNGNGSNSNGGANYVPSASQRHPSGSHRLSISSGGTGSPAQGNRLSASNGANTTTSSAMSNRRLSFYPTGSNSKPPTLPQYGSSPSDSRISPSIGSYALDRTSFSDDDGPMVRSEAYGMMSTGLTAPILSPVGGNGSSPTSASSTSVVPSSPSSGLMATGHGAAGQSGITVTAGGQVQVRGRLRSIGMRPVADESGGGHNYHGTPAIHPRLAPPNPVRSGAPPLNRNAGRMVTSNTIGSNFNSVLLSSPGPPSLPKQSPHAYPPYPSMKTPPSASGTPSYSSYPRQSMSTIPNGGSQQSQHQQVPPPKRPGRPKGAKSGGQQFQRQQQQTAQIQSSMLAAGMGGDASSLVKSSRRRKSGASTSTVSPVAGGGGPPPGIYATGLHQPGTPFSPSGLMGQPSMMVNRAAMQSNASGTTPSSSSSVDNSVLSVLDAVAAGLTTPSMPLFAGQQYQTTSTSQQHSIPPYSPTMMQQQRGLGSQQLQSMAHDSIGGPLMVGTSPIIPAHPMFTNASAGVGLISSGIITSQQQQQSAPVGFQQTQETMIMSSMTSPSASNNIVISTYNQSPSKIGTETLTNAYTQLYSRIGMSEKEGDGKPSKSRAMVNRQPKNNQLGGTADGKPKGRGRKKMDNGAISAVKTEPIDGKFEKPTAKNGKTSADDGVDSSTDEEEASSGDEWKDKDYTTRCLCEMEHNDEFMIQCDRCEVWQHCDCMGLDTKNIPDNYLCERCDQRTLKLSRTDAQRLQQAKVLQLKRKKAAAAAARRRRLLASATRGVSMSSNSSAVAGGRGRPRKLSSATTTSNIIRKRTISSSGGDIGNVNKRFKSSAASPSHHSYDVFSEATKNMCTAKVAKAIRAYGDTVGAANFLSQLPSEPPCKSMFVAVGRQGLVATDTVLPDLPIIEYRGKVCWSTDFETPDGKGVPLVQPYLLYYRSGGADGSDIFSICVDARYTGTSARFVRRSCQPNSQVKHVVCNGVLHVLMVSTEMIECGAEVTIPFDYDISKCDFELECACLNTPLQTPNVECPIQVHNKSLPLSGTKPTPAINGTSIDNNDPTKPMKRRPGRPPGSGKGAQRQGGGRGRKAQSAMTMAARKKSKNARGFKVKIVGKKKQHLLDGGGGSSNKARGGKIKGRGGKLKSQPERVGKKFKPTPTADLMKRRFSDDRPDGYVQNGNNVIANVKSPIQSPGAEVVHRKSGGRRSKSIVSPGGPSTTATTSTEPLSREERKMQSVMEQISRMEQREQKKAEKKMSKLKDGSGSRMVKRGGGRVSTEKKTKVGQAVARRKSATMDRTVAGARRKRAESEVGAFPGGKRPRLWSDGGETSSSISSVGSDDHQGHFTKTSFSQRSTVGRVEGGKETLGLLQASCALSSLKHPQAAAGGTTTTSPPQHPKAGDVAKKRWLRQAMSEETSKNPTDSAVHVDTKTMADTSATVQISPSSSTAPPKKRIIQEFSHSLGEVGSMSNNAGPSVSTATGAPNIGGTHDGPISTDEAAKLLSEFCLRPVVVPAPKFTDPIPTDEHQWPTVGWDQQQQQQPPRPPSSSSMLNYLQPEEHPPAPPVVCDVSTIPTSIPISSTAISYLSATASTNVVGFTTAPYFTSSSTAMLGDESNSKIILPSYPSMNNTTTTGLLYSAIEDNVPTASTNVMLPIHPILASSFVDLPQQVQKKKVKMSLDEYKMRKRESVNETTAPTTPNAEVADISPTQSFGAAVNVPPPSVSRQSSFIPHVKDGETSSRSIRLSSVPDPETIGKSTTTLEDLRKRIYTRASYAATVQTTTAIQGEPRQLQSDSGSNAVGISESPNIINAASIVQSSTSTFMTEPSTPPRTSATLQESGMMDDSPDVTRHRLSLTDRLRVEFGVD